MSTSDRSHPPAPASTSPAPGREPAPRQSPSGESAPARPAGERVYAWVKERILDGRLPGGELLSEGDAATALDLSRTPVREAFLRLEVEGLLRLYPKRGALVVPVSPDEADEVTEARILLESHAAERVIERGEAADVAARMRAVLDRQRALDVPADRARFSTLDREFHATLVDAAGNGLISHFYSGLHDRQVRMATSALRRVPDRRTEILAEHDTLCTLLEHGDAAGFRATLTTHINGTHGALLDS
ncbi:GntR family transcriptional regulator [Prauserella halophila]|uniref:GntR family transcriptional regulator n=1 Tax=Prauserella halophila TaxID=185641 RepID=UPI0020A363BA|nr:GntR family transcriptional regulator [Prauserella halophila]